MIKKYNFEVPERVTYGGPWISLTNAVFLFRSATGTGLFEAKIFVEVNLQRNYNGDVNTRELGEMIRAWWEEKGIQQKYPSDKFNVTIKGPVTRITRVEEAVGPKDKMSQLQDEEDHENAFNSREDGWKNV
jgi:hypothetical protein